MVEVRNVNGHYEIYLDGIFQESCDAGELSEVLRDYG